MGKNEPIAPGHQLWDVAAPAQAFNVAINAERRRPLPHGRFKRTRAGKDADNRGVHSSHRGDDIDGKHRIFFRHHAAGKQNDFRVLGETELTAKGDTVRFGIGQRLAVDAVVVNDVYFRPPPAPGEKRIQAVVGIGSDAVGKRQAYAPERRTKKRLLDGARRQNGFVGVVYVDDPPSDGKAPSGEQIDGRCQIMVAVQHVIAVAGQMRAQRLQERAFIADPRRRQRDLCPQGAGALIEGAGALDAIERPIERHIASVGVAEHAQEPSFHRRPVETCHHMKDTRTRAAGV